ncbi:hypothetical protein [Fredinandcohnia onubensis]|nr:hypothetical protein [Fredinandcohnia onubensis]
MNMLKDEKIAAKQKNSKLLVMTLSIQGKTIEETVHNIKKKVKKSKFVR